MGSILQWATFIAVAGYTFITWRILNTTHKQNALSTVLLLFKNLKSEYNEVEVVGFNTEVRHGYNGFVAGFGNNLFELLSNEKTATFMASFRYLTENFTILLKEYDKLSKEAKNTLTPFFVSFYSERFEPFINSILKTRSAHLTDKKVIENTEIFKTLYNQINKIHPG